MPADSLSLLRDAIQERLATGEQFGSAPAVDIINEEAGDLQQRIAVAVGRIGVLCVVPTPRLAPGALDTARKARVRVDLFENVLLNRQGSGYKTAPELLIEAHNLLGAPWLPEGGWNALVFTDHTFEVQANAVHHTLLFESDLLLDLTGETELSLPAGSPALNVRLRHGRLQLRDPETLLWHTFEPRTQDGVTTGDLSQEGEA